MKNFRMNWSLLALLFLPLLSIPAYPEQHGEPGIMEEGFPEFDPEKVGLTYEKYRIGEVLLIGRDVIYIRAEDTGTVYEIPAKRYVTEGVQTGYRVAFEIDEAAGQLAFIRSLGMHKEAEPTIIVP